MNYQKLHDDIINRSKNRTIEPNVYYENHHIIPRSLGGKDDDDNMVLLTAKEHFLIHKLLHFINPDNSSLFNAYWFMMNGGSKYNERKYYVGSREYERAKLNAIKLFGKECYLYNIYSDEVLTFYSGRQRDLFIQNFITNYPTSTLRADKTCIGGQYLISNEKITQEEKNNIILKGNWAKMKIIQYDEDFTTIIKEYDSVRDIMRNFKTTNILPVLKGDTQMAQGYRWVYKHELIIYGLEKLIKVKGFKKRKIITKEIFNDALNLNFSSFIKKYNGYKHQYYNIKKGKLKIGDKLPSYIDY